MLKTVIKVSKYKQLKKSQTVGIAACKKACFFLFLYSLGVSRTHLIFVIISAYEYNTNYSLC